MSKVNSTEDINVIGHTPGPWNISERDPQRDQFYIFGEDFTGQDYPVATVTSCEDPDQHEANARLIAAAPDLLKVAHWALSRLISTSALTEGSEAMQLQRALRAAIARAEGRRAKR